MPMKVHCYVAAVLLIAVVALEVKQRSQFFTDSCSLANARAVAASLLHQFLHPTLAQVLMWPVYLGYLWLVTLLVPGYRHKGAPLADGSIVNWKINGIWCLIATVGGYAAAVHFGLFRGSIIADNMGILIVQANVISIAISTFLYVMGTRKGASSGDAQYDFIAGPELNPVYFGIPFKLFFLKPAMIGWIMVNISFAYKQYEQYGSLSVPMESYQVLSGFYVFDYFIVEENMTSTWDIVAEHYGLMLNWAHLVFMPFVFSLQAHFLVDDRSHPPAWFTLTNSVLYAVGYFIFRTCNSQKHNFKHHPEQPIWGKPVEAIGGRLLVSGFWGMARHVNYMGDLLIALAMSMPCGFGSLLPHIYPLYLTLLLVHRENRDDRRCALKYKALWAEYCARVPYHIVPYVY